MDSEYLPLEGHPVLGPQPADDVDHLDDRLVFPARVDASGAQLAAVAGPEACDDPSPGEVGERHVLLGDPDRVAHRDHHPGSDDHPFHEGSQPDQGGERFEEGHIGMVLMAVRVPEEVIPGPHRIEPQTFDELDAIDQAGTGGVGTEVREQNPECHPRFGSPEGMAVQMPAHVGPGVGGWDGIPAPGRSRAIGMLPCLLDRTASRRPRSLRMLWAARRTTGLPPPW